MSLRPNGQPPRPSVLAAIMRVAMGHKDGIKLFGDTTQAFVSSLLPLIALPFVVGIGALSGGHLHQGLVDLLVSVCALLISPVVSHELARRWDREALWTRFAVAFNWCQFALSVLCMLILIALGSLFGGADPGSNGVVGVLIVLCMGVVFYGVWLHWFIAREGLAVSRGRAAFLVAAIYACTIAVMIGRALFLSERG